MPIVILDGDEAIASRNDAAFRQWPERGAEYNRVEPIARPHLSPAFQLQRTDKIFTIGSCFARHIEQRLIDRGCDLPAVAMFQQPELVQFGANVLNNYGATSIRQELDWALNVPIEGNEAMFFAEVGNDRFVDIHLPTAMRPTDLTTAIARRNAIKAAYSELRNCNVVIVTLGLAEVWFDTKTQIFLNTAPRLALFRKWPGRYQIHVLDHAEILSHINAFLDLIRENCPPDVQVLLTVSPVPMTSTFRPMDVMVANTYSKSVLRAAVEQAVHEREFVHYYPSYESVTLSDRHEAWNDDQIHVTGRLVQTNVDRLLAAYLPEDSEETAEQVLDVLMSMKGQAARTRWVYAEARSHFLEQSSDFAVEFLRLALARKEYAHAERAMPSAAPGLDPTERSLFAAEIDLGLERVAQALAGLDASPLRTEQKRRPLLKQYWRLCTQAHIADGDLSMATASVLEWHKFANTGTPFAVLARGYAQAGDQTKALHFFGQALDCLKLGEDPVPIYLDKAESEIRMGDLDAAKETLNSVSDPANRAQQRRLERLRAFLPASS